MIYTHESTLGGSDMAGIGRKPSQPGATDWPATTSRPLYTRPSVALPPADEEDVGGEAAGDAHANEEGAQLAAAPMQWRGAGGGRRRARLGTAGWATASSRVCNKGRRVEGKRGRKGLGVGKWKSRRALGREGGGR